MQDLKEKRDHVAYSPVPEPFGISDLDRKLNGSMKEGGFYLISGETGVGKTTLCIQSVIAGARLGENGAIIVTDEGAKEYVENAKATFPDFAKYYSNGQIVVIELTDAFWDLKWDVLSNPKNIGRYLTKIKTDIGKIVAESGIRRLAIDSLTPLLPENDKLGDIFISQVIETLAMPGVLVIATSGILKSDLSRFGFEENSVSGIIKLESTGKSTGEVNVYTAKVVKMSGEYVAEPLHYTITTRGLMPVESGREDELVGLRR